jgi:hypothetical protein
LAEVNRSGSLVPKNQQHPSADLGRAPKQARVGSGGQLPIVRTGRVLGRRRAHARVERGAEAEVAAGTVPCRAEAAGRHAVVGLEPVKRGADVVVEVSDGRRATARLAPALPSSSTSSTVPAGSTR